jgi:predicted enzyme related to lactoylglutathione lyase
MQSEAGRFVWSDLNTTDPEAARAFYPKFTGWGTTAWDGSAMPYTMWMVGDRHVGGCMELHGDAKAMGAPPHWLPYIASDDVDATVALANSLGGRTLMPPMDIENIGRWAILQDPQGAVFAAWKSARPGGERATGVGTFSWHELATSDPVAAFEFYGRLFGWAKTDAMDMGPQGTYQMYGQGGETYGGIYNKGDMPFPPHWLCYVTVANAADAAGIIKDNGGRVLNGPMQVPGGGTIAQCLDPQGAAFAVYAPPTGA